METKRRKKIGLVVLSSVHTAKVPGIRRRVLHTPLGVSLSHGVLSSVFNHFLSLKVRLSKT